MLALNAEVIGQGHINVIHFYIFLLWVCKFISRCAELLEILVGRKSINLLIVTFNNLTDKNYFNCFSLFLDKKQNKGI